MLGTELSNKIRSSSLEFIESDIDIDIANVDTLRGFAEGKSVDWIINASAYTAVDKAESEEDAAHEINALGVRNIARVAFEIGAKVVHFSTDYVFDGSKPEAYLESDDVNPISAYGRTKLEGERELAANCDKFFIFRISWLYGIHGANFVKTMVRLFNDKPELGIVGDQKGAPTYTGVLADNIIQLVKSGSGSFGVYHYSDEGEISWYDFAVEICRQASSRGLCSSDVILNSITTEQFPTPAKRPSYSMLNKSKVKELGFDVLDWKENLKRYFNELENI